MNFTRGLTDEQARTMTKDMEGLKVCLSHLLKRTLTLSFKLGLVATDAGLPPPYSVNMQLNYQSERTEYSCYR